MQICRIAIPMDTIFCHVVTQIFVRLQHVLAWKVDLALKNTNVFMLKLGQFVLLLLWLATSTMRKYKIVEKVAGKRTQQK